MGRRDEIRALQQLSDADLRKRLEEAHREVFTLRFRHATRQLDNPQALRAARKIVARVKTLLRERELARTGEVAS